MDDDINTLIRDYLRGTLDPSRASELESRMAMDDELAADVAFQRNLVSAAPDTQPPADGWARLQAAMQGQDTAQPTPETADTVLPFKRPATPEPPVAANDREAVSPWWRIAAACLAVAAVGQMVLIGSLAGPSDETEPRYVTASDTPATPSGATVQLRFDDLSTATQIETLLKDADARIVNGPGALGLYDIAMKDAAACEAALPVFRESAIVKSATVCW